MIVESAYAGYWFYGAADAQEMASLYCSWGLLDEAPAPSAPTDGILRGLGAEGPDFEGPEVEGPDFDYFR